jgi:CDP-paratose 2-epimerase
VRDLLHVDDLAALVDEQLADIESWAGEVVNVGGGRECSLSLVETTALCEELTGNSVRIDPVAETRPGDVRIYISDCARLHARTSWRPRHTPREILDDVYGFVDQNAATIDAALGPGARG